MDDGLFGRLKLEGKIEFAKPVTFVAERVEFEAEGFLGAPSGKFTARIGGRLGELRKLIREVPDFLWTLETAREAADGDEAVLMLIAGPDLKDRIREAGLSDDASRPDEALKNEAWCAAAFDLAAYECEGLGLVTRS